MLRTADITKIIFVIIIIFLVSHLEYLDLVYRGVIVP